MRTWRPTAAQAWIFVACIVSAGVLALCIVFGPALLAGPQSGLTAAARLSAENAARSTLLQVFLGFLAFSGVAFGAVVTLGQVKANFADANLANATLLETTLRNTNLSGANLREANLTRALLDGAILRGADLSKANLQDAQLAGVIADRTTKWPHGFVPAQPSE